MSNNTATTPTKTRPPIVVVLGHVDHGKTLLLSTIRKTKMPKEAGDITQHIGAYQVEIPQESKSRESEATRGMPRKITFLDTPGHEAFSAIRSRGAKVADVAVLVVAADEGVKPQTKEAIKIIKEAEIPFIAAINKIDKEGANPQKVRQDLAAEEVLTEDWGGQVPVVEVSAKEGKNINELLDMILLVAELEELQEDLSLPAEGVIIESNLDKRRGYVATALVQKGVLSLGDWMVVGTVIGKVKMMEDFLGNIISKARPSEPVVVTGWPTAPVIGQKFVSAYTKDEALLLSAENVNLAPLFQFFKAAPDTGEDHKKYLNIVFKSDVSSSVEALDAALKAVSSPEVGFKVISYDIGNISESDVQTAITSGALVFGFRVGVENSARKLAEKEEVVIETFYVIYDLIGAIRKAMSNLLEPEISRNVLGKLKVLAVFKKDARAQIIGGKVVDGKMARGALVEAMRDSKAFLKGKLTQLQQEKEDVTEVKEGAECGLRIELIDFKNGAEIKEGDIIEVYEEEKKQRSI